MPHRSPATRPWPPRTSNPSALLDAYTRVLGWSLSVDDVPCTAREAAERLERLPDAVVSTECRGFDVIALPARVSRIAALHLERDEDLDREGVVVPAFHSEPSLILLVRAGTSEEVSGLEGLRWIAEGGDLVVPPGRGLAWDTPPWKAARPEPAPFPDAARLKDTLTTALAVRDSPPPP
ncbi:hypothetical protein [Streptomyces yaizuensis]|uniref:Uncharacterized protein n=1 Tax=Streptomyces yaizuensis TaxID=2989713 RepID=A0ABQ5NXW4_9ACTN|nr:hypothetical protein [Streptomyces sp. YSPA8]GLF95209.1 hypothetical protein SYYSPA8_12950 [Streptomyces sp. YSPA8]